MRVTRGITDFATKHVGFFTIVEGYSQPGTATLSVTILSFGIKVYLLLSAVRVYK